MPYDVSRLPAEHATAEAGRRARLIAFCFACYFLIAATWLLLVLDGRFGLPASVVALAAVVAVRPMAKRYLESQLNWHRGAEAERSVGHALNQLRYEGWILMHDVEQEYEGNIDHIASGPGGVFLVETKLRRYQDRDLTKAKRQAAKLAGSLQVWVTPVIVLHKRSRARVFKHHGVWVVPQQSLLDWLREQRNTPVEFETLARFADRL